MKEVTKLGFLGGLLTLAISGSAFSANNAEGIKTQYDVALDTPINHMQILGAHNAWNDSISVWANQRWSLDHLMDAGIRNIDLDVHLDSGGVVALCHQDCSAIYAAKDSYHNELAKIKTWLNANPKAIVFIDLEDRANYESGVEDPLTSTFGSMLYKPSDKPSNGWHTPREMIAKGKRVIVKSANNTYSGSLIFSDNLFAEGASGGWNSRQVKFVDTSNCTMDGYNIDPSLIYTISDSKLAKDLLPDSWIDQTGTIDSGNIPGLMKCGIDIVDADRWSDDMITSTIWSWNGGEPNNYGSGEDCAELRADNGRWNDNVCAASRRFACQNDNDVTDWRITSASGNWSNGAAQCASEFSGYSFSVPSNALMNEQLRSAASGSNVWIAYSDQAEEGKWVAYTQSTTTWTTGAYNAYEDRAQTLRIPGATSVKVSITGATESNNDYLYIYDSNRQLIQQLSGAINTSFMVQDSSVIARLTSDGSTNLSGVTVTIEKPSNTQWVTGAYGNNENRSKDLAISGAAAVKVYVTGETESNYDYIYIYNKNGDQLKKLHGSINTSFMVSGDGITARFTSDGSVTRSGVKVSIKAGSALVYRELRNGKNKCLELEDNSTSNGNAIHHWDCQGQTTQRWYLDPDGLLRNKANPAKCVDASGSGTGDGTDVVIWDCHGGANQQWSWSGSTLRPAHAPSKALDIDGAGSFWGSWNGSDAHLWGYHGGWGQNWHWGNQ